MNKRTLKPISRKPSRRGGRRWQRQLVHHACKRLGERYGLYLDTRGYEALCEAIRQALAGRGGSPLGGRRLYRRDGITTWHLVRVDGRPAVAVWDARFGRIVSFVPPADLATAGLKLEDVA
jgi:hypothetical protein